MPGAPRNMPRPPRSKSKPPPKALPSRGHGRPARHVPTPQAERLCTKHRRTTVSPDLLPRFAATLADIPRSTPCIAAVSGGLDSVVLLDLLRRARFRRIAVAHFHHGLRGKAADRDSHFVEGLARKHKLAFIAGRGNARTHAALERESLEEAARNLRRKFLACAAHKHGATVVFIAHHANDAAETALFNLARGSGLRGLSGLRTVSPLEESGAAIVRPMLGFTRAEIESYALSRRLRFREDESNASRDHTRNRLRHDALPALAAAMKFDPVPPMARAAAILAAEDAWMDALVADDASRPALTTRTLRAMHAAHQRRLLRAWLRSTAGIEADFAAIEKARAIALSSDAPAKMNLPGGLHLRRRAGVMFIEPQRKLSAP